MDQTNGLPEIKLDADNLYREENFTDRQMGTIRVMTPVTKEGEFDSSRKVEYIGQAQMMTPMGAIPIVFELDADNLAGAIEKFADSAKLALEKTVEELKEMQRQQASSIVLPDAGGVPPGMGGGGGGIQMP